MNNAITKSSSLKNVVVNFILSTFVLDDKGHNYFQYAIFIYAELQIIGIIIHFSVQFFEDYIDSHVDILYPLTKFQVSEMISEREANPNFDGGSILIMIAIFYLFLLFLTIIAAISAKFKKFKLTKVLKYILSNLSFINQQILFTPILAVLNRMIGDYSLDNMIAFGGTQSFPIFVLVIVMLVIHSSYTLLTSLYNIHPLHEINS